MKLNYLFVSLVAALSYSQAGAAGAVLLQTPIAYDPNAGVVQQVREECKIEDLLAKRVSSVLAKRNRSGTGVVDTGANAQGAGTLKLTITHVLGVGGGAWSGPKAITVKAELFDGPILTRQQKLNRWSVGGVWGAFKGTCTILDRVAVSLAKDLGRWSFDANFKPPEDEPMPKDAAGEVPTPQSREKETDSSGS